MNTIITSTHEHKKALRLAKSIYQRNIINGHQALSGADFRSKARRFADRYARSRTNLLKRMADNGINFSIKTGPHNKKILVIGRLQ